MIRQVACREDAWNGCGRAVCLGDNIAPHMRFQLVLDQFVGGGVADGDEDPVARQFLRCARVTMGQAYTCHAFGVCIAEYFVDHMVPYSFDLGMLEQTVLQDFLGAQRIPAMHQRDLGGKVGQKQGFLHGGIAPPYNHNFPAPVEEAIAGGACGDAEALEGFFALKAEPARLRTGCQDHSVGGVCGATVADGGEGAL